LHSKILGNREDVPRRIAVIGAGQLGSRHFQGLAETKHAIEITAVDPNFNALHVAKKIFDEMPLNPLIQSVKYLDSPKKLNHVIDLAIISTNSDIRRKVIEILLDKVMVNYLILEKVVFQSIKCFEDIMPALEEKKIKVWVNCPRRKYPFFQKLREETILSDSLKICVKGSSWGLASNTIHMLDLFAFLSGQTNINLDISELDKKLYKSKRAGFIELGGRLLAKTNRGDILELVDDKKKRIPLQLSIEFSGKRLNIDQQQGLISIYSSGTIKNKKPFHMPLQSEMTASVAEQILETGNSDLTPLHESYLLHRAMLDAFNQHLSEILNKTVTICPVT
jgi:hypothetical protein